MKLKIKDVNNRISVLGDELIMVDFDVENDDGTKENGMGYAFPAGTTQKEIDNKLQEILGKKKANKGKKLSKVYADMKGKEYSA